MLGDNLKPWDGREPAGVCKPYPTGDIEHWRMMIDDEGNIWYKDAGGKDCIWCPASRLTRHMIKLGYRMVQEEED